MVCLVESSIPPSLKSMQTIANGSLNIFKAKVRRSIGVEKYINLVSLTHYQTYFTNTIYKRKFDV